MEEEPSAITFELLEPLSCYAWLLTKDECKTVTQATAKATEAAGWSAVKKPSRDEGDTKDKKRKAAEALASAMALF
eukprot:894040-Lingulodinium_polyedra.AAC.1